MAGLEVESVEERRPSWTTSRSRPSSTWHAHPNADRLRLLSGPAEPARRWRSSAARATCRRAIRSRWRSLERCCRTANTSSGPRFAGRPRARDVVLRRASSDSPETGAGGIMILPADAPVGTALASYLGAEDTILELSVTPNRGDCLSVLGVAREVAALTGAALRERPIAARRGEDAGGTDRACRGAGVGPLSALCGAHRPRSPDRALTVVDADAARDGRAATHQQRRRCHELRDDRARTAVARVRSAATAPAAASSCAASATGNATRHSTGRRANWCPTISSSPMRKVQSRSRA